MFWITSSAEHPSAASLAPTRCSSAAGSGSTRSTPGSSAMSGGHSELEQMGSTDPPLVIHRLYGDGHRQLRRLVAGAASRLGDLLAAVPARLAPVQRSVPVRVAVYHQMAQRAR